MLATIVPKCEGATIIYCKSSGVAGKVACELVRLGYGQPFQCQHIGWVAEELDPEWDYTYALRNGIGPHFGGLPWALQQYINADDLRFLLCIATIMEGVNTVAKNVVIYDVVRNFGHQNEVILELVPGVSSSFSYGSRQTRGSRSLSYSSSMGMPALTRLGD